MDRSELKAISDELYTLLDSDPRAAVARAREIARASCSRGLIPDVLIAGLFIDAGAATSDADLIREALATLETFEARFPEQLEISYNMANAMSALAQLQPTHGPSWHLDTLEIRQRARLYFDKAVQSADADIRARSYTNLGNELWRAHRWVEAYDAFQEALLIDSSNAVARIGALKVLLWSRDLGIADPALADAIAARHLHEAANCRDRLWELAGAASVRELDRLLAMDTAPGSLQDLTLANSYARFVANNRLALSLSIEGLQLDLNRWDSLQIRSVIETKSHARGVPPVFSIFNTAKSEYLTARWLCYKAMESEVDETGTYGDSLDYARYGMRPALLVLAQRASVDVLDKIAFLISEYLQIEEDPQKVEFQTRWHKRNKKGNKVTD